MLLMGELSASWHPVSCIWDPPQSTGLNFLQSLNCVSKSFICKIFVLLILWQLSFFFACNRDRTSVVHFLYFHKTIEGALRLPTTYENYPTQPNPIHPHKAVKTTSPLKILSNQSNQPTNDYQWLSKTIKYSQRISKTHTWYLSFFLHEQNFWRIKFTPKDANFSR